jgi:hypothetical protein
MNFTNGQKCRYHDPETQLSIEVTFLMFFLDMAYITPCGTGRVFKVSLDTLR